MLKNLIMIQSISLNKDILFRHNNTIFLIYLYNILKPIFSFIINFPELFILSSLDICMYVTDFLLQGNLIT